MPPRDDTPWLTNPAWSGASPLVHGLATRHFAPADLPREERLARIRDHLAMPDAVSVVLDQVHQSKVARVTAPSCNRAQSQVLRLAETDAVVTDLPNVLLHLSVADCVPILAVDQRRRLIGAAHAGWRGTVKKIAAKLMRELAKRGADLDQTQVWLGPSIGPCCFEVGDDTLKRFTAINNWWPAIDRQRRRVDLALVNRLQIARSGVPPDNMTTSPLCTRCRADLLHSHRAEPDNPGRLLAVIGLRPPAA